MLNVFAASFLLLATANGISTPNNLLVVYGNGDSEIIIKDVNTGITIKTFIIQIEKPTGGIVIVYEKDYIFFADKYNVYRIHLVDKNGNQRISGRGELFTNITAEHVEMVFFELQSGTIKNLLLHDNSKLLYLMFQKNYGIYSCCYLRMLDHDSGHVSLTLAIYGKPCPATEYLLRNETLFASRKANEIYSITIDALRQGKNWNYLTTLRSLSHFTLDKLAKRLFYAQNRNLIQVLDYVTNTTTLPMNTRVVIANSRVTKNIKEVAVYGTFVIWSSFGGKALYIGHLNENLNFISTRDVKRLDMSSSENSYEFNNIIVFEDSSK